MGHETLKPAKATAQEKGVARVESMLTEGDSGDEILEQPKENAADLIAMGSRGLGRAEGILAGSISYKHAHSAVCSCMLVR